MANPTVSKTVPSSEGTNAYIDQQIVVTIDDYLDSSTINTSTILLYPTATIIPIAGEVLYSNRLKTITFIPKNLLEANTEYTMLLVGQDSQGNYIKSANDEGLEENYIFSFTTGTSLTPATSSASSITSNVSGSGSEEFVTTVEPSGLADDLRILSVAPVNRATNIDPTDITEVIVTFNQNLDPNIDPTGWITVYEEAVDDDPTMDASGRYMPGTTTVSDNTLTYTFS